MIRIKRLAVLAVSVVMVLMSGCDALLPPEEELLAPPLVEPQPVTYKTVEASLGTIEDVLTISAYYASTIYANVSFEGGGGRVEEMPVKYGDTVKKGDLLIQLSSESIRRQIAQQKLVVEKAQLNYDTLLNKTEPEAYYDLTKMEVARLDIESARSRYLYLIEEAQKAEDSFSMDAPNLVQQRDQALISLQKAEDTLISLEADFARWQREQETKQDNTAAIDAARIDLDLQRLVLSNLNTDFERTRLYAPIDGIISYLDLNIQIGENIEGYVTLMRIADPTQLVLQYTGEHATKFSLGAEVIIEYGREQYPGTVVADPRSIPMVDGKMANEVRFAMNGEELVSAGLGESVRVRYVQSRSENVIVIPKNSVNSFWGRKFVNVLEDDIKVEKDVETGIETSTEVEIRKGLELGDLIILP